MQPVNIGSSALEGPFHFSAIAAPGFNNNSRYDLAYAISCLPVQLREWLSAITNKLEVDPGMALATLLSAMGAGLSGGKVVRRPDDGREPLACFTVILAGPTTGKTRTHKLVHTAHNAHDIWRYNRYQQGKHAVPRGTSKFDRPVATPESATRLRSVLLQDTSYRGLLETLEGVGESAAISVHEGERALDSVLFRRHLGALNVLQDGEGRVSITRGKSERVTALDATLTMLVMVQPDIFKAYLATHGKSARSIGFLARCLFCVVPAFALPPECGLSPDASLAAYHNKVEAFLTKRLEVLESGQTDPDEIVFSPAACELWHQLMAEQHRLTSTVYWQMQDAANRAMQNVARISGIIHCYLSEHGDISSEALLAAWAIVQWHMTQFADLFQPLALPVIPRARPTTQEKQLQREIEDGNTILRCIGEACWRTQKPDALKNKVAIRSGLYNHRFRTALMRLVDESKVLETGEGNLARLRILQSPLRGQLNQSSF